MDYHQQTSTHRLDSFKHFLAVTLSPTGKYRCVVAGVLLSLCFFAIQPLKAQSRWRPEISGYIKELGQLSADNSLGTWRYDNIIHHRIENTWNFADYWEVEADLRTRLLSGFTVNNTPGLRHIFERDSNYFDLSWVWFSNDIGLMHSQIDRAYLSYFNGPWEATVGRQRLNWSRTFVWSPNDLFHNFAYLDFDYEERPGTDAINLQYNWSYASSIQVAGQLSHRWDEAVIAGMLRTNWGTYDIQLIGGHYRNDLTLGAGWAGYLGDAGFKGELSYFHPEKDFFDRKGHITATTGVDYMFSNGLYLQGELLYNGGYRERITPLANLTQPPSADNLFIAKTGYFVNGSYEISPLVSGQLGFMGSFDRSIFIAIPQLSISVTENLDLLLLSQLLKGTALNQGIETPNLFFFRLKYSY